MRQVVEKLHELVGREEEDKLAEENPRTPIIMGDFTNWRPKLFTEIIDYSESFIEQFDEESVIA